MAEWRPPPAPPCGRARGSRAVDAFRAAMALAASRPPALPAFGLALRPPLRFPPPPSRGLRASGCERREGIGNAHLPPLPVQPTSLVPTGVQRQRNPVVYKGERTYLQLYTSVVNTLSKGRLLSLPGKENVQSDSLDIQRSRKAKFSTILRQRYWSVYDGKIFGICGFHCKLLVVLVLPTRASEIALLQCCAEVRKHD
ncbi:Protein of unknown function [Gryllus bimaculatus]|nr:Protein of unknown function [Gryllus bimaculatus]